MTHLDIAALEHAGRSVMTWSPEGADGRVHVRAVLLALIPAVSILAVAASILFLAF